MVVSDSACRSCRCRWSCRYDGYRSATSLDALDAGPRRTGHDAGRAVTAQTPHDGRRRRAVSDDATRAAAAAGARDAS